MAVELGTGYVSLTVQAKGIARQVSQELGAPVARAAAEAGDEAGKKFSDSFADEADKGLDPGGSGGFGGVLKSLGTKIGASFIAAGAIAGAALAKGVQDAYAAEAANDKLAAQLGLPPDRAAELGKAAGNIYRDAYGESLGQVNDTIARLFQDGLVPEDATVEQIEAISAKVLDLSTAFDQDLGSVTRGVGQLMRTGLADNADEALDIITRGFQQGADKSEDFLDTLNEYGTQFRKLGIDGATATGLIVQGLQAGARDGDKVADAIKEFSIRAVDGSDLTTESFKALGLSAEEMTAAIANGGPEATAALDQVLDSLRGVEDPAKRSQIAVGLFGTQAEDLGDALFALDLDKAARGLGDIEGAAARMGDTLNDNATVKIEEFKRKALGGLADFAAQYVIPAMERFGSFVQAHVVPALQSAAEWIRANVLPALQELGTWIEENVLPVLGRLGAWITDTVIPALKDFGGWVKENVAPALQEMQERVENLLPHLEEMWRRVQDDLLPPLKELWQRFKDDILPIIKEVAEYIFQNVVPAFLEMQGKIEEKVMPVIETLITLVGDFIDLHVELYDKLKAIGTDVKNFVSDAKDKLDELVDFISDLPGDIADAASGMWDGIKDAFRSALNFVIDGWNNLSFSLPSVDTKIPGVGTIGGWTLSTPNIPRLATGGVITRPTLALMGETARARPEIVSPVGMMRDTFEEVLNRFGGARIEQHFHDTRINANEASAALAWTLRTMGA